MLLSSVTTVVKKMHSDLSARRRAVVITYRRFLNADRAWNELRQEMMLWFPSSRRPQPAAMGNPGSAVRKAYDRRARAIAQLEVAVLKLYVAKRRIAARQRSDPTVMRLLPAPRPG